MILLNLLISIHYSNIKVIAWPNYQLKDMFDVPDLLKDSLCVDFRYQLYDMSTVSGFSQLMNQELEIFLTLMKYRDIDSLSVHFDGIFKKLINLPLVVQEILTGPIVYYLLAHFRSSEIVRNLIEKYIPNNKEAHMAYQGAAKELYDVGWNAGIEKGTEQGFEQGIEKGIVRSIKILKSMIELKFNKSAVQLLNHRLEQIKRFEDIDKFEEDLKNAKSIEELL